MALYDLDNPDGPDHDYYRGLADELAARIIEDLGCGTGLLTVSLGRPSRRVIGVDPDPEMLTVTSTLAFRGCDQLVADLETAGFRVISVRGGWQGEELDEDSGLIVVEAQRRPVSA